MDSSSFRDEHLLRELTPQVLATLIRRYGDFASAEDAVQEALIAATVKWERDGVPDNPRSWLIQVASRRLKDYIRSEIARRRRESVASAHMHPDQWISPSAESQSEIESDDTLLLLFMCCHPALTRTSAIALTLRAVGGLTTAEIANAYLVPEATMAQRISRAKQRIKASGMSFQMPTNPKDLADQLGSVLHVLYLIFNEGYASSIGPNLLRNDLASEAIRLTRAVHNFMPDHSEVAGLLALMLLTHARRLARINSNGEAVPLAEQDRTKWDRQAIEEGTALLVNTIAKGEVGPYQLQAAIAALHDEATEPEHTDWPQILALYELLKRMVDNPIITLNHAVAFAMVHGPVSGLKLLADLDTDRRLAGHYRLDVIRAHLYDMSGHDEEAINHYQAAANKTTSMPERSYLAKKATELIRRGNP